MTFTNGSTCLTLALSALLGALGLAGAFMVQAAAPPDPRGPPARTQSPAPVAPPCCVVSAIDARGGLVAARETATGRTFQFGVPQNLLPQIRAGQKVWVDSRTQVVSLEGAPNCCKLVSMASPAAGATVKPAPPASSGAKPSTSPRTQTALANVPPAPTAPPVLPSWKMSPGSATRPAILLFHGNGNDRNAWMRPSAALPQIPGMPRGAFDFRHTPDTKRIGKDHDAPNAGVYKVGFSDSLETDAGNWWDFFIKNKFTVATWSQDGPRFAEAYASAKVAFATLVHQTKDLKPLPPIALVGHSRGGLLIRKLLKESPPLPGVERVRWVVTLHSPHHGSDMARAYAEMGAEVVDLMDTKIPASIPGPFGNIPITAPIKAELKKVAVDNLRFLDKWWMADNNRELMTDGPLVRDLAQGETPLPDVKYYTFGGDNPTYLKYYVWVFDPNSAVPQYKVQTQGIHTQAKQYFVWRVKAVELSAVSPLLDRVRNFTPEVTPGKGDGFVSDKSARLPFSIHETTRFNHLEVLWDKGLQLKVLGILAAQ